MKYNKLVRDKIPEIIESKGGKAITHTADDKEFWRKLKQKLNEETVEFIQADDVKELADILEVIYAIADFKKLSRKNLQKMRKQKLARRGGFNKRIILEEVTN